jgi:hypothetical protein
VNFFWRGWEHRSGNGAAWASGPNGGSKYQGAACPRLREYDGEKEKTPEEIIVTAQSEAIIGQTVGLGLGVAHTAREAVEKTIALMKSDIVPVFGESRFANWRKSGLVTSPTRE